MAAVLKTVGRQRPGGSNPSASAKRNAAGRASDRLFLASGPSKACFRKGWKTKTAVCPKGRRLHSMLCRTPGQGIAQAAAGRAAESRRLLFPPRRLMPPWYVLVCPLHGSAPMAPAGLFFEEMLPGALADCLGLVHDRGQHQHVRGNFLDCLVRADLQGIPVLVPVLLD